MAQWKCDVCKKTLHDRAFTYKKHKRCEKHKDDLHEMYLKDKEEHDKKMSGLKKTLSEHMEKNNISPGSRVRYFVPSLFGIGGREIFGTVKIKKNGIPYVWFDKKEYTTAGIRRTTTLTHHWNLA